MGYSTTFKGELKFKNELTASQIALLKSFLGKDRRDIFLSKNCREPLLFPNIIF